nr:hypothetical protein [Oscillospiraceae bacterium]
MKKLWKERTASEKLLCIARPVVSLVILCSAILKFLDLWEYGLNLAIPLFAVYYLLEAVCNWKTNRDVAAFSLFMTVFIAAVSFAVFFL